MTYTALKTKRTKDGFEIVLAEILEADPLHPYVTWLRNDKGIVVQGHYFKRSEIKKAELDFNLRR